MAKHITSLSALVLAGLALSQAAYAQTINWGANFETDTLTSAANFVNMFLDPINLIVAVLCAVIGIGAVIGYLKH